MPDWKKDWKKNADAVKLFGVFSDCMKESGCGEEMGKAEEAIRKDPDDYMSYLKLFEAWSVFRVLTLTLAYIKCFAMEHMLTHDNDVTSMMCLHR